MKTNLIHDLTLEIREMTNEVVFVDIANHKIVAETGMHILDKISLVLTKEELKRLTNNFNIAINSVQ